MRTTRRLIATFLIASSCSIAFAGAPFSWETRLQYISGVLPPNPSATIAVPQGMLWRVEFASGYMTTSQNSISPGVVRVRHQDATHASGGQTLFLDVRPVILGPDSGLSTYSIGGAVAATYSGVVTAQIVAGTYSLAEFSLIGTLVPALTADFNGDSVVNAADYTTFRDNLGAHWQASDYAAWVAAYGTSAASTSATSAPEPVSAVAFVIGTAFYRSRRRPSGTSHF